jgi:hypothetical protein
MKKYGASGSPADQTAGCAAWERDSNTEIDQSCCDGVRGGASPKSRDSTLRVIGRAHRVEKADRNHRRTECTERKVTTGMWDGASPKSGDGTQRVTGRAHRVENVRSKPRKNGMHGKESYDGVRAWCVPKERGQHPTSYYELSTWRIVWKKANRNHGKRNSRKGKSRRGEGWCVPKERGWHRVADQQGASCGKCQIETTEGRNAWNRCKKALTLDWMVMRIGSLQALSHARE